jgi:hypothetical protein
MGGNVRRALLGFAISGLLLAVACGGSGGSSSSGGTNTGGTNGTNTGGTNGTNTGGGTNGGTSTAGNNTPAAMASNVATLTVDGGPTPCGTLSSCGDNNMSFVTIIVCPPNTSPTNANCVTIDHVWVDTGSDGLRIPSEVFTASQLASLPNVKVSNSPIAECIQYAGLTYNWGSVRTADVYIGGSNYQGEVARAIPIQVMGDSSVPEGNLIPTECSQTVNSNEQQISAQQVITVSELGARGLIGVGPYISDCDFAGTIAEGAYGANNACTSSATMPTGGLIYFSCPSPTANCSSTAPSVPYGQQVSNPVAAFAAGSNGVADNNGVILELPQVAVGGVANTVSGSLVFGIGTQTNNALSSSATVLAIDTNINNLDWAGFYTVFNGVTYPNAAENSTLSNYGGTIGGYIDSGSSIMYFLDQPTLATNSATSSIVDCTGSFDILYCPTSGSGPYLTVPLSATNMDFNGNSRGVNFNVSNGMDVPQTNVAYSDLAGPNTTGSSLNATEEAFDGLFDWGLPFFYGRNVYTSVLGVTPPSGVQAGPWWAY